MVLGMAAPKGQALLRQRADVLRHYEVFSYQVAFYVLEDEILAAEAASQALLELLQVEEFYNQDADFQKQMIKKSVIKNSLLSKAASE